MSLSSMTSARLRASHYFSGERNACMAISASPPHLPSLVRFRLAFCFPGDDL